jgi:hypothetical protein
MKKKILIGSFGAVLLLILTSYTSVIGFQTTTHNDPSLQSSPLFVVQTLRSTNQKTSMLQTSYLHKGYHENLFLPTQNINQDSISKALQFFTSHPAVFKELLSKLQKSPYYNTIMKTLEIKTPNIIPYLRSMQNNPSLFVEQLHSLQSLTPADDTAQPLGLSTSNPLGCFIVAVFALLPVTIVITLLALLFTLRVLTCMNVNDCANTIANSIWQSLLQGLTQQ